MTRGMANTAGSVHRLEALVARCAALERECTAIVAELAAMVQPARWQNSV